MLTLMVFMVIPITGVVYSMMHLNKWQNAESMIIVFYIVISIQVLIDFFRRVLWVIIGTRKMFNEGAKR